MLLFFIRYKISNLFPGKWKVLFLISGTPMCVLNLTTDMPNAQLTIIQEPIPNNGKEQPIWNSFRNPVNIIILIISQ